MGLQFAIAIENIDKMGEIINENPPLIKYIELPTNSIKRV